MRVPARAILFSAEKALVKVIRRIIALRAGLAPRTSDTRVVGSLQAHWLTRAELYLSAALFVIDSEGIADFGIRYTGLKKAQIEGLSSVS